MADEGMGAGGGGVGTSAIIHNNRTYTPAQWALEKRLNDIEAKLDLIINHLGLDPLADQSGGSTGHGGINPKPGCNPTPGCE